MNSCECLLSRNKAGKTVFMVDKIIRHASCLCNLPPSQHYKIHFEGPFAKPVVSVVVLRHIFVIFPATQLLWRYLETNSVG